MSYFELMGFGPQGWGGALLMGTATTLAVSVAAFALGGVFGALGAAARVAGGPVASGIAAGYVAVLRGIPDLLVIYLLYFGGSAALTAIGRLLGAEGFVGAPAFATGALAVGIVSGAFQTEVLRGAYLAVPKGQLEAAKAMGMGRWTMLRRITAPQVLRFAVPGLGNVWQLALKESALVSVTGLAELLRTAQIGSGSTRQPFAFFATAAALYLVLTTISGWLFKAAEARAMRGVAR